MILTVGRDRHAAVEIVPSAMTKSCPGNFASEEDAAEEVSEEYWDKTAGIGRRSSSAAVANPLPFLRVRLQPSPACLRNRLSRPKSNRRPTSRLTSAFHGDRPRKKPIMVGMPPTDGLIRGFSFFPVDPADGSTTEKNGSTENNQSQRRLIHVDFSVLQVSAHVTRFLRGQC